jgi:hypothetical protein
MSTDAALEAIIALRDLWERKHGRVTLGDLGLHVSRRVRSRGNAPLPPERWRCWPWERTTSHEVVFET